MSKLTLPEIRRILEGQRVHNEIKQELREAQDAAGPGRDLDDALGRTVPRESDHEKLRDLDERIQNAKAN